MSTTNVPGSPLAAAPPRPPVQTTGASVARGSLWQIVGTVIPQAYSLGLSVLLAQYLGPDGLGRLAFIQFVAFTLVTSLTLGLPTAVVNFTGVFNGSGRAGEARALLRWMSRITLIGAAVALATMTGFALFGASPKAAWIFEGIGTAAGVMGAVPAAFLRGFQRWRALQIVAIASGGLAFVLKAVALPLGAGVTAICAIDIVAFGGNFIGTTLCARREARTLPASRLDPPVRRLVLRFAGIASISAFLAFVVYHRTEMLFLGHYSTDAQIALYYLPFTIVSALTLLTWSVGAAFGPAVATLWGANEIERIRSGFSRSLRLALLVNVVVASALVALGPAAITLIWGEKFADAGPVLVILAVTLPFAPLMTLSTQLLNGIGRPWGLTIFAGIAAVANIGLDFGLIPAYDAVGAAVANSLAQLVGSLPLFILAARVLGGVSLEIGVVIRAIFGAVTAGLAAALVVHELPSALGLSAGVIVFAITLVVTGMLLHPLSRADSQWVESLAGGPLRRPLVLISRCVSGQAPMPWHRERK
jgi:O-antigen/teichoic acid export membrane protein